MFRRTGTTFTHLSLSASTIEPGACQVFTEQLLNKVIRVIYHILPILLEVFVLLHLRRMCRLNILVAFLCPILFLYYFKNKTKNKNVTEFQIKIIGY